MKVKEAVAVETCPWIWPGAADLLVVGVFTLAYIIQ
jgi:hypothetical protein